MSWTSSRDAVSEGGTILDENTIVDTLNNCQAYYSRCAGYCRKHHCYVTKIQMKRRQCTAKNCKHFEKKNEDFWKERQVLKALKKLHKQELEKKIARLKGE